MSLLKFSMYSLVIGIVLYTIGILTNSYAAKPYFIASYPYFISFFLLIGIVAYKICLFGLKKSADSSVFVILGSVVAKLLLSMVLALIFIYGNRIDKIGFLISFFLPYFIYSTFEIYSLMHNLRALKK